MSLQLFDYETGRLNHSRQRAEVWTWRLMAALARVAPIERVEEQHGAGGLYDTIAVKLRGGPQGGGIDVACNRPGHVHVFLQPPNSSEWPMRDLVADIEHGLSFSEAANWIVEQTGDGLCLPHLR